MTFAKNTTVIMKKTIYLILSLTFTLLLSGCASVKVLKSWKGDNISDVRDNNFMVITRMPDNQARIAFENEIVKQLSEKSMKASASFEKFPSLNPTKKVTDEQKNDIINKLKEEGYNAVVLTVVKDVEDLTKTTEEGGYYAGGNYYGYYPMYYGGFSGYYHNPRTYITSGNYVPKSFSTTTAHNYVLETVIYNLDEESDKQLVAVVTSKLEEPETASSASKQYVKAITKSFDKK